MSAGPATKMYEALEVYQRHHGKTAEGSPEVVTLTPATLEAMDAAAEVMGADPPAEPLLHEGGIHPDWVVFHARDPGSRTGWRNVVCLAPKEADELLRVLLERAIKRRKEAGHG